MNIELNVSMLVMSSLIALTLIAVFGPRENRRGLVALLDASDIKITPVRVDEAIYYGSWVPVPWWHIQRWGFGWHMRRWTWEGCKFHGYYDGDWQYATHEGVAHATLKELFDKEA